MRERVGNAEISRCPAPLSYDASVAKRIGELLVEGGILSQSQLEQALFAQRKDGRKLGQLLVELGLVTEEKQRLNVKNDPVPVPANPVP